MLLETKPKDHLHDNDDKKYFFHHDVSNGHVHLIKCCGLIKIFRTSELLAYKLY